MLVPMQAILELEIKIFVETDIRAGRIHVVCGGVAEIIPLGIKLKPITYGNARCDVESVCPAALRHLAAECGCILSAYGPVVTVELEAGADAAACKVDCGLGSGSRFVPAAPPDESSEVQALDRLELEGSDEVFFLVRIG